MSVGERLIKEEEFDSISIYISNICFLHGHLFRSGLLRSQSTYSDISAASNASLTRWRNSTWSPRPTLGPKTTSNEEQGGEYLNQESSICREFKSIKLSQRETAHCTASSCRPCWSPFNPLKKSFLITPTTSWNLTQDVCIELENCALRPCNLHPSLKILSSLHFPVYKFGSMRAKREKGVSGPSSF